MKEPSSPRTGANRGFGPVGFVRIAAIHSPTPASRCGLLRIGDLLMQINGHDVTKLSMVKVRRLLASRVGDLKITVKRRGHKPVGCEKRKDISSKNTVLQPSALINCRSDSVSTAKVPASPITTKNHERSDDVSPASKLSKSISLRKTDRNRTTARSRHPPSTPVAKRKYSQSQALGNRKTSSPHKADQRKLAAHLTPPPAADLVRGAQELLAGLPILCLQVATVYNLIRFLNMLV